MREDEYATAGKLRNIPADGIDGFIPSRVWFPVDPWRVLRPSPTVLAAAAPICSRPAPMRATPWARPISPAHWPIAGRTSPPTAPCCWPASTPTRIRDGSKAATVLSAHGWASAASQAQEALDRYNQAVERLKSGDWKGFGTELDAMRDVLEKMNRQSTGH